jgi:hypothetical protein
MATVAFDSHRTISHSLAGTEMAPLRMMPASHSGYELTTVSKILDGHTRKCALTRTGLQFVVYFLPFRGKTV